MSITTPSPSPLPVPSALPSDIGIETFLTILAVVVFAYALGTLVLHVWAAARKAIANRRGRPKDHYDTDY